MQIQINPVGNMNLLSKLEIEQLQQSASSDLFTSYRNCSLVVLNAGSHTDNAEEIFNKFQNFNIEVVRRERGVKIELTNPPKEAFVDGKIILGIKELLSAVLRDILFINHRYVEVKRLILRRQIIIRILFLIFYVMPMLFNRKLNLT